MANNDKDTLVGKVPGNLVFGIPGKSAYQIAVENGFEGTILQWLQSLQGKTAYEYAVEGGFEGTEEEFAARMAECAGASEDSDGVIAVSGATVGQTIKITAVDAKGVPTQWEPVDFPTEKEWKLITDTTIEEADAAATLFADQDDEGSAFSYTEVVILWQGIQVTDGTSSGNAWISINGTQATYNSGKCGAISVNYFYYTSTSGYTNGAILEVKKNCAFNAASKYSFSEDVPEDIHSVEVSAYGSKSFYGRVVIYGR